LPKEYRKNDGSFNRKAFYKVMKGFAEERDYIEKGVDISAIRKISRVLIKILEKGGTIERAIVVNDYKEFIQEVKEGKNGLGQSWSWSGGKLVQPNEGSYEVYLEGSPEADAIDYIGTYGHYQIDYLVGNPDDEIVLREGGILDLRKGRVYNRQGEHIKTIPLYEEVEITHFQSQL